MYVKFTRTSEPKFREILKLFCTDLDTVQIAEITDLSRNTVNKYLREFRQSIAMLCESESLFKGEVEVQESYLGTKRVKGKRGMDSHRKTIVFGIFKRKGSVHTEIVPDCSKTML